VDLAVPRGRPLAELLPGLAERVGVLDRSTAYRGYRAVTLDGRALAADDGLSAQGIGHGDVVTIVPCAHDAPESLYDDPADAVARAVEALPSWRADWRRRTGLGAAVVLLLTGVPSLLAEQGNGFAVAFGAAVSVLLLAGAARLSRRGAETAAVAVAVVACLYATAAASCVGSPGSPSVMTALHAGSGLTVSGVTATLILERGRLLLLPTVAAGAVLLVTGLATSWAHVEAAPLLTCLLTLVVLAAAGLPAMALGTTGTGRHVLLVSDENSGPAATAIDTARVAVDVAVAREVLLGLSATVGALLVLLAPAAVSLGPAGTAVPLLGCMVVMLRSRRCRVALDGFVGIASGVLGVVSTVASALVMDDRWRLPAGTVVAAAGVVVLVAAMRPHPDSVRRGRLGDLAEGVALGALVPALLAAVGLDLAGP
jgi:hypothetical protein